MKLFAVYDAKAQAFLPPVCIPSVGEAVRWFGDQCSGGIAAWSNHPGDYQFFLIGDYDTTAGSVANQVPPQLLSSGLDWKKPEVGPTIH